MVHPLHCFFLSLAWSSIDARDWTQIKTSAPTAAIGGVTGNSGTLLQTISTGITEIANTNISAHECKNQARDIINVGAAMHGPTRMRELRLEASIDMLAYII